MRHLSFSWCDGTLIDAARSLHLQTRYVAVAGVVMHQYDAGPTDQSISLGIGMFGKRIRFGIFVKIVGVLAVEAKMMIYSYRYIVES